MPNQQKGISTNIILQITRSVNNIFHFPTLRYTNMNIKLITSELSFDSPLGGWSYSHIAHLGYIVIFLWGFVHQTFSDGVDCRLDAVLQVQFLQDIA